MKQNTPKDASRRRFFSKGAQAAGSVAAAALVASSVAVEAAPVEPIASRDNTNALGHTYINWPCAKCQHEHRTPAEIFEATKFNTRCSACATIQPYRWHLMKFDPRPTDYVKNGTTAGHPMTQIYDQPPILKVKR